MTFYEFINLLILKSNKSTPTIIHFTFIQIIRISFSPPLSSLFSYHEEEIDKLLWKVPPRKSWKGLY